MERERVGVPDGIHLKTDITIQYTAFKPEPASTRRRSAFVRHILRAPVRVAGRDCDWQSRLVPAWQAFTDYQTAREEGVDIEVAASSKLGSKYFLLIANLRRIPFNILHSGQQPLIIRTI